ncbi:zinc ribbon domain-containing protein [Streptomyces sp. NPDC006422]|uniref:zinc ribbon domain-containing protein n=1 Tax=unclassified Streptomyces TaxID=2593676 RepID=UPI0033B83306
MDESVGEELSARELAQRVGWASDLVSGMTAELLAKHFNGADVGALASGVDADGRRLPSKAWMALRRLGWASSPPVGVRVNDRIVRMAQEAAGRALRSVQWRAEATAGVLSSWPADPSRRTPEEWNAVRAAVQGGESLPSSVIASRTRQIAAFQRRNQRLPADVFELEGPPRVARMLLLSACDRQQAAIERSGGAPGRALLRLQLPICPEPASYADWTWVACPIVLPPTVPSGAVLHLPTLRPGQGMVWCDLAYTHPVPRTERSGHVVALGVDWGINTLLSAGSVRLHDDGTIVSLGDGGMFRAGGVVAKGHRLRRLAERLSTKADHYERLGAVREGHPLEAQHRLLTEEIRRVCARRTNLNAALARAAARWAVDQAIAVGAGVIYVEDLRSLEAKGKGRAMNARLSQQVRGRIVEWMRHLAAEVGISVVTVPARDTSRRCPYCLMTLRHCKAPDRPTAPGWKWAVCSTCGWQGDRDQGAWRRIATRGLAHQANTVVDRTTGIMSVPTVVDELEARAVVALATDHTVPRDRSKHGPTPPRSTSPAPRRRRVPSPVPPSGSTGQRPEGHVPTGRMRLPRAAHRFQGVTTISSPTRRAHRPRGAALGAGFHLHVHATPPRWVDPGRTPCPTWLLS